MGRLIAAIVVGCVAMYVLVLATFSAAYHAIGSERAFQPGVFEVTGTWIFVSMVLGFAASVVAGVAAYSVAGGVRGSRALAVVLLVLGLMAIVPRLVVPDTRPEVRSGHVGIMQAMQNARQPAWTSLLNPFIAMAGVLAGGVLRDQRP